MDKMDTMDMKITPKGLYGDIQAIPSKSGLHRALICAALSEGESTISNTLLSQDIKATALALKALGAEVRLEENRIVIKGLTGRASGTRSTEQSEQGQSELIEQTHRIINCGESGSTLRFMIPVTAALGIPARFQGEGQLPKRPLQTYFEVLGQKGITFDHPKETNLPLAMQGSLKSGHYSIPGSVSSQYITGLLLALPLCAGDSVIEVVEPFESKAYVDITLAVMARFGILLEEKAGAYHIRGGQSYTACDYAVEGDWSQTAAWLCAGAVNGEVTVYGMDPASKQGDAAVMDILKGFGARIEILSNGGIRASRDKLAGVLIDAAQIPDIIPVLAAVAVYARGKTKIINAGRLRYKESDRLAATAEVLSQLGADIKIDCDSLIIHGRAELQGGEASGHNDHRIVMALAVSASGCREPVTISGYGCIDKSYPHFFEDYRKLGGEAYGIDTR